MLVKKNVDDKRSLHIIEGKIQTQGEEKISIIMIIKNLDVWMPALRYLYIHKHILQK